MADEVRRQRHGASTTFVRVASVAVDPSAPLTAFGAAGEVRIVGTPASRQAAVARVRAVAAGTTAQLSGVMSPLTYCIELYDPGNLTQSVSYTVTVVHP